MVKVWKIKVLRRQVEKTYWLENVSIEASVQIVWSCKPLYTGLPTNDGTVKTAWDYKYNDSNVELSILPWKEQNRFTVAGNHEYKVVSEVSSFVGNPVCILHGLAKIC